MSYVYLITGGTGSLGTALVRRLLKDSDTHRVRIFSRDEFKQSEMRKEFTDDRLRWQIGDIRDLERLKIAFQGVDYVIHTAALKQVHTCEYNPHETIMTNIDGSRNVVIAAQYCGVRKVMGISSDKAVEPVSLYGATKLVMERLFIQANMWGNAAFSLCRMGNFIGSRGSVIPMFLEAIKTGKIVITDDRCARYWIDLPSAADFVVQALRATQGGEIYIPSMQRITVKEWSDMIAHDAVKEYIGLRDGERLDEPLWSEVEKPEEKDWGWLITPQLLTV